MFDIVWNLLEKKLSGREVVIWGYCETGRLLQDFLRKKGISIRAFVDKKAAMSKLSDQVLPVEYLSHQRGKVYVVVATNVYHPEIESSLLRKGYVEELDFFYLSKQEIPAQNYQDKNLNRIEGNVQGITISFTGNNNVVILENDIVVNGMVRLKMIGNGNHIKISAGVSFDGDCNIVLSAESTCMIKKNCSFGADSLLYISEKSVVAIGHNSSFEDELFVRCAFYSMICIGEDAMASKNVSILLNDGHPISDIRFQKQVNIKKEMRIGKHVWIGNKATIVGDCTLGNDIIIGANSIVSGKKFMVDHCILAGIPARVIRENVSWARDPK